MARARRYHLAGQIWHLIHRCYHLEVLLRFARDWQTWIGWLFEARKHFDLCVGLSGHFESCPSLVYDRTGRRLDAVQSEETAEGSSYWKNRYHAAASPDCVGP